MWYVLNMNIRQLKHVIFISLFFLKVHTVSYKKVSLDSSFLTHYNIMMYEDNTQIGAIRILKPLMCNFCIFYNFYIYPEFRQKGYGSCLLRKALVDVKMQKISTVYIQPGPFEISSNLGVQELNEQDKQERLFSLLRFYKKHSFRSVSKLMQKVAYYLYVLIDIDENSKYLLSRNL